MAASDGDGIRGRAGRAPTPSEAHTSLEGSTSLAFPPKSKPIGITTLIINRKVRFLFTTAAVLCLVFLAVPQTNKQQAVRTDHLRGVDDSRTSNGGGPVESAAAATATASWTIPQDLRDRRKSECEGGRKISQTGGFCLTVTKHIGGNHLNSEKLADYFATNIFKGDSVTDLGAGLGHYGKFLTQHATHPVKSWQGYDGAINVQAATDGLVKFMDLTQPGPEDERPCGAVSDWVLSLEVGEHIPPEHADSFLRNVRCRATKGAVISWALPHQTGGLGHVNMKTEEEVVPFVERWGFQIDWDLTKGARASAGNLQHFERSVYVFRLV